MVEVLLVFAGLLALLSVGLFLWAVAVNTTSGPLLGLLVLAIVMFELMDVVLFLGRRKQDEVSGFSPELLIASGIMVVVGLVLWVSMRHADDHGSGNLHNGMSGG